MSSKWMENITKPGNERIVSADFFLTRITHNNIEETKAT